MATSWKQVATEGLILGGIGYAATVVFFAVANLLAGHSAFYTPAVLGSLFFYGLRDGGNVTVWAGPVIAFNGIYLILMLFIGVLIAWLASEADRGPAFLYLSVFVLLFGALHMTAPAVALNRSLGKALPVWSLIAAGILAAAAMLAFVYFTHPALRAEMFQDLEAPGA